MAGTFEGKSMRPGGGGRFAKMKAALQAKGKSASAAAAIAAVAGRRKWGSKKMSQWSAAGRKRNG